MKPRLRPRPPSAPSEAPVAPGGLVTLQGLADRLRLAKSTVSLALSGRGTIAEATRRRVRAAAERLGYRPDPLLAALSRRGRRPGRRDVPVAFITSEPIAVASPILEATRAAGSRLGYTVRLERVGRAAEMGPLLGRLYQEGFGGLIFHHVEPGDWLQSPLLARLALVQCRMAQRPLPVCTVRSGILSKTHEVYERVLEAGYSRIGSVIALTVHDGGHLEDQARLGGALGAAYRFRERATFVPPLFLRPSEETVPDCIARARAWLAEHRPDALVLTHSGLRSMLFYRMSGLPAMAATLLLPRHERGSSFAGMRDNMPAVAARCLEMVDQLLRGNRLGVFQPAEEVVLPSLWKPGASLPPARPAGAP